MARAPVGVAMGTRRVRGVWKRLGGWRAIQPNAGGIVLTVGAVAVGFAAVNTGNNLLYLLLGATLGMVVASGWFSERAIRDVEVSRETPAGVTVGQEVRITYHVKSRGRSPVVAVEISEDGLAEKAFLARMDPGGAATVRSHNRFVRRGVYPLRAVTLSTTFPFGLFVKEREIPLPGELVIWPRTDRPVRPPATAGSASASRPYNAAGAPGMRGEYRAMHEYRPGEDARDIHWRTSARLRTPVVREYEADGSDELWICLDTRGDPGDDAETLVEIAASLAAAAAQEGRRFGLVAAGKVVTPASGPGHLELVLDHLARVDFRPDARPPVPPPNGFGSVLVSLSGSAGGRFGGVFTARGA